MGVGASEPAGAALLARVAAHGGRVEGLAVRASGGERGVYATRPFAAGEALVPLGDLVNHAPDPGTRWTCDPRDGFVLRATRALPVGELFVTYGPKSNARYLLAYGFTLADNPVGDMELALGELGAFRLELDPDTPEVERLLFALGGDGSGRARLRRARALLAEVCRARLARLPDDTPAERADARLRDVSAVRADERAILAFWAG